MGFGEGLGGLTGGIIGSIASGDERGHERALVDEAIATLKGVKLPTDLANRLYFQNYINTGQLTPAQEAEILNAASAESQVKANPELIKAQMQALSALKGLSQTGMTSADRARLNQIQQQMQTQEQGQRQAIMQNFAQRGQAGSGNELMAQLMNAQNAANQANQEGLGVAANAQQNALAALGQYGGLAGQMGQQQFGQDIQTSQAADQMNRFNTQNRLQQQARNIAAQNMANQANWQNAQNIANQNTGLFNQDLLMQRQGKQQMFENELSRAKALSGAQSEGSKRYGDFANQISQQWSNIGKGVGGIGDMAFGGPPASQNTMGTNKQSGGITQGAADILSNYNFGAPLYAQGGEVPSYSGGGSTGGFDGLTEEQIALVRAFHDGGYLTPNQPYSFGGHVPKSEDQYVRTFGNGFDAPNNFNKGGMTNCYSMGGETVLTPAMSHALNKHGGKIPGKAEVPGDSYANDKVHIQVSPGEIIIPRSIVQSPRAGELAKHFVEGEIEKHSRNGNE